MESLVTSSLKTLYMMMGLLYNVRDTTVNEL